MAHEEFEHPSFPSPADLRTAPGAVDGVGGVPLTPATDASRVLLRLDPAQIVDLHAVLEGYDDLALLRTIRAADGLVEVWISPGFEVEFEQVRQALGREGLPTTPVKEA